MMVLLNRLVLLLTIPCNCLSMVYGDTEKLSHIYANLLGADFDIDHVTKEYLKVCPKLEGCRGVDEPFTDMVTKTDLYKFPIPCPSCSCKQDCVINNECCPNVIYGYLQYDCVSSVKLKGTSFFNETSFYMIASCPKSLLARNNLSETNESVIPVTSYTTGLTYPTKEFAECNGDDDALVIWNTTYHCQEISGWDVLIIDTFEDLLHNLKEGNCEIRLSVTNPKVPHQAVCNGELYLKEKVLLKSRELLDKCNMTGLWEQFDPYIDFACQRLSLPFGNYKNVFCYMCNPGLSIKYLLNRPTISTCDHTFSGTEIEKACFIRDKTSYYLPYKNVFCLLCNKILYPFIFASRGLHESWILVQNIDENIVAKAIGRLFRAENSCKSMSPSNDSAYYETSMREEIRFNQEEHSCIIPMKIQTEYDGKNESETSDCEGYNTLNVTNRKTVQLYKCSDLLERDRIAKEVANIDRSNDKEELLLLYILHTYLCEDLVKSNNVCEPYRTDATNSYSLLSNNTGKSLSCLICKTGDIYTNDNTRTKGFDILLRITCPTLLQPALFLDTFSLLEATLDNGCSVRFYPTGVLDPIFFNVMGFSEVDECIDFPWIDQSTCLNQENTYYFGSYRKLFSVSNIDWKALLQVEKRQRPPLVSDCPENFEVPTTNTNDSCRDIFCSEGHVLVNDVCKSEFETYVNIMFELDFQLEVTEMEERTALVIDASIDQAITLHLAVIKIEDVCDSINDIIRNQMNENITFSFEECIVKTDTICSENSIAELAIGSHIEISIKVLIHFTKELSLVEEILIDALSKALGTHFVSESGVRLSHFNHMRAVHMQLCFRLNYTSDVNFISKQNRVSKLLTCPQIQLLENEYKIDNATNTLQLLASKVQIKHYSLIHEHVRVCLEDFNANSKSVLRVSITSLQKLYKIFDNVCTILSLSFMFVTFVTYLIFPSLRNVPGLNNMSLILSLFFAQTTLKFGIWQSTSMTLCPVFGILIHFFWLATFCSMNICCIHMYRVFSSNALSLNTFNRKTSVIYLLYTYLIPVSVIVLTIFVHLALSEWQDFGYGKTICFLTDYITIIIAFICPCVFVFLLNILFFSKTFVSMRSTLSNPRLRRSSERRAVFVYLRLSTLLGIAWPLLIVDAFLQMSVFSFFALIVNTLQGLFVFFSLICNRRVLNLYLNCVFRTDSKIHSQYKEKSNENISNDRKIARIE